MFKEASELPKLTDYEILKALYPEMFDLLERYISDNLEPNMSKSLICPIFIINNKKPIKWSTKFDQESGIGLSCSEITFTSNSNGGLYAQFKGIKKFVTKSAVGQFLNRDIPNLRSKFSKTEYEYLLHTADRRINPITEQPIEVYSYP